MEFERDESAFWKIRQPLTLACLVFILGILLQDRLRIPLFPHLAVLSILSIPWFLLFQRRLPAIPALLPIILSAAAVITELRHQEQAGFADHDLQRLVLQAPQQVSVKGRIISDPIQRSAYSPDDLEKPPASILEFQLAMDEIHFMKVWEPARGNLLVRIRSEDESLPLMEFGQLTEIQGLLTRPHPARNFGVFDYALWLKRQDVHFMLQSSPENAQITGTWRNPWVYRVRGWLAHRLTLGIENDSEAAGIIRGMLLGYRSDIPPDVSDAFRKTGTLHIFAISGSHISLIALGLLTGMKTLRVPRRRACLLVLPILVFYVCATGMRASSIRALLMAGVVILGWSINRPAVLMNSLAAAALIILAWDPFQLFDPGFQLSFVVVIALIFFTPSIQKFLESRWNPDPYIPRICIPPWRQKLIPPTRWVATLMALCMSAWMGSLGLQWYYFSLVSWLALLANLLVVPLASLSVGLSLISLAFGWIWDSMGACINTTHAWIIHGMMKICDLLASIESGCIYLASPHPGWIFLFYVGLGTAWVAGMNGWKKTALSIPILGLLIPLLFLFIQDLRGMIRLDVLDVGSGQCVLITGPGRERILLDAGNRSQGAMTVESFLRSRGVNRIDLAIISHGDAAHYGGFLHLKDRIPISKVILPDAEFKSKGYHALLDELEKVGIPLKRLHTGDSLSLQSGDLHVLWPSIESKSRRADDLSLVLELRARNGNLLFAADTSKTIAGTWSKNLPSSHPVKLLVQGVTSDEETPSESFLEKYRPERVILNSDNQIYHSRDLEKITRHLETMKIPLLRTDQTGGLILLLDRMGVHSQSFLPSSHPE